MKIKDVSIKNKDWAFEQYVSQQKSLRQIRDETGLGINTIKRWLKKHGIQTRLDDEIVRSQKSHKLRENSRWKGKRNNNGYRYIYHPNHPLASKSGYINEHRFILEQALGRIIDPDEWVHHDNMDKTCNFEGNLTVCTMQEHRHAHASFQRLCKGLMERGIIYFDKERKEYGFKS